MRETVLAGYTLIPLNYIALGLFLVVFIGSVIWTYRKSGKSHYAYMEKLPLDAEDKTIEAPDEAVTTLPGEKVLDHHYDGIRELDNPLPAWWVQLFYVTIAFSAVYFVVFTFFVPSAGERADRRVDQIRGVTKTVSAADLVFDESPQTREAGRSIFGIKCAPCHLADGGGLVGPNLTDNFWIHGKGTVADIYHTVTEGVPEKGMISWKTQMSDEDIRAVSVYVRSLQGTKPAAPRPPQGDPV